MTDIEIALDEASTWLDLAGVVGVGQGEEGGRDCIVVMVAFTSEELTQKLPSVFHGFSVVIQDTGEINTH